MWMGRYLVLPLGLNLGLDLGILTSIGQDTDCVIIISYSSCLDILSYPSIFLDLAIALNSSALKFGKVEIIN